MKQIIISIFLFMNLWTISSNAQTAQNFLKSCIQTAKDKGASNVIVKANLCSGCEGVFEGFVFFKLETYQVRYIKYFDGYENVKVIKDTTFEDTEIKNIFDMFEIYQDSIFMQLENMDSLLKLKVIKDGKILFAKPLNHGKMILVGVYNNEKYASSLHSIISLDGIFKKAYFYWLLNSSINNYCNDHFKILFSKE